MSTTTELVLTPGWDASARSIKTLSQNGAYSFKVKKSIGIVCGLNNDTLSDGYKDITHGFLFLDNYCKIIELGKIKTSPQVISNKDETVFKITRINKKVFYYINDILFYTSLEASEGIVFLDCSMYDYLDMIFEPNIHLLDDDLFAIGDVFLKPLTAFGINDSVGNNGLGLIDLLPLIVDGENINRGKAECKIFLSKITTFGIDDSVGADGLGLVELLPLKAFSDDALIIPEYNAGFVNLKPLALAQIGFKQDSVESAIEVSRINAFGTDSINVVLSNIELLPLNILTYLKPNTYIFATLPNVLGLIDCDSSDPVPEILESPKLHTFYKTVTEPTTGIFLCTPPSWLKHVIILSFNIELTNEALVVNQKRIATYSENAGIIQINTDIERNDFYRAKMSVNIQTPAGEKVTNQSFERPLSSKGGWFNHAARLFVTKIVSWTDVFKIAFIKSSYTLNLDNTEWSEISTYEIPESGDYTAGGFIINSMEVSNTRVTSAFTNFLINDITGDPNWLIIYASGSFGGLTDPLVGYIYTPSVANGSSLTCQIPFGWSNFY